VWGVWAWPLAVEAIKAAAVVGLNLWGVAEAAAWIGSKFFSEAEAAAGVPQATRDYYATIAARWGEAGQAVLVPARAQFFGPVAARAIELIESPATTHAEIGVTIAQLADHFDNEVDAQGGPVGVVVTGDPPPVAPAGAIAGIRDPLGVTVAKTAARGFLVGAGFAALLGLLWWRYGD